MNELTPKSIKAISRASVKIGDSFFTFEYGEERDIPYDFDFSKLQEQKDKLWDDCNAEIDKQIEEIKSYLRK